MHLKATLLFVCNDLKVIVIPHTLVGIVQAMTGPLLTTNAHPDARSILSRFHLVLLWNSLNLLTFNLANQRLPQSVEEDSINKPWRPIPSGLITAAEAKWLLLLSIPITYLLSLFWTGGATETLGMVAMTWLYNDLGGGSESVLLRHGLNGGAFALHTYASTMIAANQDYTLLGTASERVHLTPLSLQWLVVEGLIVSTTIHAMDLPDMKGDLERGRRTLPLVAGERLARSTLAIGTVVWSAVSLRIWNLFETSPILCIVLLAWSVEVARRALFDRDVPGSAQTYKMWCVWLMMVYMLPWLACNT